MAMLRGKIHLALAVAAGLSFTAFAIVPAAATTFTTLYSFSIANGTGWSPKGGLAIDGSGNFFGTTYAGGSANKGAVFELSPNGSGGWNYQLLYSFCSLTSCADGSSPKAGVIVDVNGNLWGTTSAGGANSHGLIFKLHYSGSSWGLTDKYDFCPTLDVNGYCDDGALDDSGVFPGARLSYAGAASGSLYDGTSKLYGVTPLGGTANFGVAFRYNPGGSPAYKVLYQFCTVMVSGNCADGGVPRAAVTVDSSENLFGTTAAQGAVGSSLGTVYELTSASPYWSETTLYTFCCQLTQPNEGGVPEAGLIFDASGNILGTTTAGGSYNNLSAGAGVEFKLTTPSVGGYCTHDGLTEWCITIDKFCKDVSDPNCTHNGSNPASGGGMVMDASSNLYGEVTGDTGWPNVGRIFKISAATGSLSTIHTFCSGGSAGNCPTDGYQPNGGLVADSSGNFYGVTENGGANNGGTIFEITP